MGKAATAEYKSMSMPEKQIRKSPEPPDEIISFIKKQDQASGVRGLQ
jgi:hypothetical protein